MTTVLDTALHTVSTHSHAPKSNPDDFALAAHAILEHDTPTNLTVPGLDWRDLELIREGIFRFDEEVPREKQSCWMINVPRDPDYQEPDDGVIRKNTYDKKLYLHLRASTRFLLRERGVELSDWQVEWFEAGLRVREACIAAFGKVASHMDEISPGRSFYRRFTAAREEHCLRVLKYEAHYGTIATPHTDRSSLVGHLDESAPGLYGLHSGEKGHKTPYPTPKGRDILIFTGDQLEKITQGTVPALLHGVDNFAPDAERYALVFFGKMYGVNGVE